MKEIKGIIVPILTPMHEDETVNYEELVNQIERLIAAGVHGIFVFGTNGEGYIEGGFTLDGARELAMLIQSGACGG